MPENQAYPCFTHLSHKYIFVCKPQKMSSVNTKVK